jgi:hypothetical protein
LNQFAGSVSRSESASRTASFVTQIFSSDAISDRPTLSPEKESLLSVSAGALSKEIHWFGPGILFRFRTANPPMPKAPTAAAAVASGDEQRVGCHICRAGTPRY